MGAIGYNARNDEIRDNITRIRKEWEARRGALATVRRFNATLSDYFFSRFEGIALRDECEHWGASQCVQDPDQSFA